MNLLPFDLKSEILQHCSLDGIGKIAGCCKVLREACLSDNFWQLRAAPNLVLM